MKVWEINLRPFLPRGWEADLERVSKLSIRVSHMGGGPGSLSPAEAGLDYDIVTLDTIYDEIPWTKALHLVTLPVLLNLQVPTPVTPITQTHGLTLNRLRPDSVMSGLEWHLDGADVARVVVLPTRDWAGTSGGRLLYHDGRNVTALDMHAGGGLSVPTGDLPHAVEAPQHERLTLMFAFTDDTRPPRAEDLTTYIAEEE